MDIEPGDIMVSYNGVRYLMVAPLNVGDIPNGEPEMCQSEEHEGRPIRMWRVRPLNRPSVSDILCPWGMVKE